jgi:hypothetical protein
LDILLREQMSYTYFLPIPVNVRINGNYLLIEESTRAGLFLPELV